MNEEILRWDAAGLLPAIIQEESGQVLMLAYMNREALDKTRATGRTWFYSRSRARLWMKGEESGHVQTVKDIRYDCDGDALLVTVEQTGAACHTGHYSCFYRDLEGEEKTAALYSPETIYGRKGPGILYRLYDLIRSRQAERPEGSYTTYLFAQGIDKILKKVGEESAEVIIAAKNRSPEEIIYETSDLFYHLLVMLVEEGVELKDIFTELEERDHADK
jgi:phosphoribosyl-ATP pyrophosphohydrolase/phosphoribosyl-AMP cyclohydrolase